MNINYFNVLEVEHMAMFTRFAMLSNNISVIPFLYDSIRLYYQPRACWAKIKFYFELGYSVLSDLYLGCTVNLLHYRSLQAIQSDLRDGIVFSWAWYLGPTFFKFSHPLPLGFPWLYCVKSKFSSLTGMYFCSLGKAS